MHNCILFFGCFSKASQIWARVRWEWRAESDLGSKNRTIIIIIALQWCKHVRHLCEGFVVQCMRVTPLHSINFSCKTAAWLSGFEVSGRKKRFEQEPSTVFLAPSSPPLYFLTLFPCSRNRLKWPSLFVEQVACGSAYETVNLACQPNKKISFEMGNGYCYKTAVVITLWIPKGDNNNRRWLY